MSLILSPVPKLQLFNANGLPLAGGTIATYAAGTNTPLATYSDINSTPNTNPVVMDAAGRATIFIDSNKLYKYVIKSADGTISYTTDFINSTLPSTVTSLNTMADLKALDGYDGQMVVLGGYYLLGDGGGGEFYYDSSSIDIGDDGMVVTPNSTPTTGRWMRIAYGAVNVLWYGAKSDGTQDDTSFFTAANTYCASFTTEPWTLVVPAGLFNLVTDPGLTVPVKLEPNAQLSWSSYRLTIKPLFDANDFTKHFILDSGALCSQQGVIDICVEHYGAVGDGSFLNNTIGTDDTEAIQSAVSSAYSGQWIVFNSTKKYFTDTVSWNSGVNIRGSQSFENDTSGTPTNEYLSNIFFVGAANSIFGLTNTGTGGLRGITIKDLVFDGNNQSIAILDLQTTGSLVINCTIRNALAGILFGGSANSSNNRVHMCNFRNLTGAGITNQVIDYGSINGIISDNIFFNVTNEVFLGQYSGWAISNNVYSNGNTVAQMYGCVFGNDKYVTSTEQGMLRSFNEKILGATVADTTMLESLGGWADNSTTHTASTNVWNRKYLIRNATTTTFDGARFHDALGQDTTDLTPRTDTRAYYERDFGDGSQHWGDEDREMMVLDTKIATVSTSGILSVGGIAFGGNSPIQFNGIVHFPVRTEDTAGATDETTLHYQLLGNLVSFKYTSTRADNFGEFIPTYRLIANNPIPIELATTSTLDVLLGEQTFNVPIPIASGFSYAVGDYIIATDDTKANWVNNWYSHVYGWGVITAFNNSTGAMTVDFKTWSGSGPTLANAHIMAAWPWFAGYSDFRQPYMSADTDINTMRITPINITIENGILVPIKDQTNTILTTFAY